MILPMYIRLLRRHHQPSLEQNQYDRIDSNELSSLWGRSDNASAGAAIRRNTVGGFPGRWANMSSFPGGAKKGSKVELYGSENEERTPSTNE